MLQIKLTMSTSYQSQWHKFISQWEQLDKGVSNETNQTLRSNMALLQYQITIYKIYIERFMNPRWKLTKHNISAETNTFEIICQYFNKWMQYLNELKTDNNLADKVVGKYFISFITYNNMKTMLRGFIGYAECIISSSDNPIFVPALHSNQSSLECFFKHQIYG